MLFEKKASTPSEVMIWVAVVSATLLCLGWFFNVFYLQKPVLETTDNDLITIQAMLNDACNAFSYTATYNPKTETGILFIEDKNMQICIAGSGLEKCKPILCKPTPAEIDLSVISEINISKVQSGVQEASDLNVWGTMSESQIK